MKKTILLVRLFVFLICLFSFLFPVKFDDAVLVKTLYGHQDHIFDLDISSKFAFMASASKDQTIKLWSFPKGRLIKSIKAHGFWVYQVKISSDGKKLISAGCDRFDQKENRCVEGLIKIWDVASGRLIREWVAHESGVWSLLMLPKNNLILSGGDKEIFLWNLNNGSKLRVYDGITGRVLKLDRTPKGNFFISSEANNLIKIWNIQNDVPILNLNQRQVATKGLSINQRKIEIAWGEKDGAVFVWDFRQKQSRTMIKRAHKKNLLALKYSSNGKLFATAGCDLYVGQSNYCQKSLIKIWSPQGALLKIIDGQGEWSSQLKTIKRHSSFFSNANGIWDLTFSPDNRYLVSAGRYPTIKVWDISMLSIVREYDRNDERENLNQIFKNHQKSLESGKAVFYSDLRFNEYRSPISRQLRIKQPSYTQYPAQGIINFKNKSMEAYLNLKDRDLPKGVKLQDILNYYRPDLVELSPDKKKEVEEFYSLEALDHVRYFDDEFMEENWLLQAERYNGIALVRNVNKKEMERLFLIEGFKRVMNYFVLKNPRYEENSGRIDLDLEAVGSVFKDRVSFEVRNKEEAEYLLTHLNQRLQVVYRLNQGGTRFILERVVFDNSWEGSSTKKFSLSLSKK